MVLLSVKNVYIGYTFDIVRNVSFDLASGEILAIVGESGSGKSTLLKSIVGKHPGSGTVRKGNIYYQGKNIVTMNRKELLKVRGNAISMIFQSPGASLNPVRTIGTQFIEMIRYHTKVSREEAYSISIDMLEKVNLPEPERIMNNYAFQLSGGMKQRVSIAMALALKPKILLADEPTSALDATVQKSVVEELLKLHDDTGTSIIIVTHNMMLAHYMADRIAVMYAGEIVEVGDKTALIERPRHPYTKALINSIPRMGYSQKIQGIPGTRVALSNLPQGCLFANRCSHKTEACLRERPAIREVETGHYVACDLDKGER